MWAAAASPGLIGTGAASVCAFIAVALAPGWLLSRRFGFPCAGNTGWITQPARALTFSVALVAIVELLVSSLNLSMNALLVALFGLCGTLTLSRAGAREATDGATENESDQGGERIAFGLFALVAILAIWLAVAGDNIARDRMWYSAWINALASADTLDWTEPFFGTEFVPARFAHNAWLSTLGAIVALSKLPAPTLLGEFLPPVLTLCTASAVWMLADAIFCGDSSSFGGKGRGGYRASLGGLAGLLVLLTTHYPFFSPEHYAFFGRLPEDKFVALLIFVPVAIATLWRFIDKSSLGAAAMALAACTAVAFSHALVQLVLILSIVAYLVWRSLTAERAAMAPTAVAIVILATTSLAPGLAALRARSQIVETPAPVTVFEDDTRHPVVRSHLRMQRLTDIPVGGPIVAPSLIAEPMLALSLLGLLAIVLRVRERWAAFILATSITHLALAFLPFLAPTFGRIVVPWMAYRALWGIPFGLLLGAALIELVERFSSVDRGRRTAITTVALAIVVFASPALPWDRLGVFDESNSISARNRRIGIDIDTRELLSEISTLPPTARIAAAAGLAELIPAFTGRHILAFADRGTIVFTGRRRDGERRLLANAVLIGLYGGSPRIRNRAIADFDVTHTIYENRDCDRRSTEIYRSERFTLCAERFHTGRRFRMRRTTAVADSGVQGATRAMIGDLLICTPKPIVAERTNSWRWTRESRWSGKPVAIDCKAEFPRPTPVGKIRIELNLPKANEALVYRARIEMTDGDVFKRQGVVEFRENPNAELSVPPGTVERVRLRLVPAYLPYLNARALDLRS